MRIPRWRITAKRAVIRLSEILIEVDRNNLEHGIKPRESYLNDLARKLIRKTRNFRAA